MPPSELRGPGSDTAVIHARPKTGGELKGKQNARGHIFQRSTWPAPLSDACADFWTWDKWDCSPEVCLYADQVQDGDQGGDGVHHAEALKTAHFHPTWSNGTAGVRGTRVLNHGVHYWEVQLSQRVFGTSMMVGVGTRRARLHLDAFTNLLGEDAAGWGFSHKGLLWHDGSWRQYAKPFRENAPATVGVLFDGRHGQGTVTFFKDGVCLGVAFEGLNEVKEELFPVVCSTAAKTEMRLGRTLRGFDSLQDRCRAVIAQHCQNNELEMLPLPTRIKGYIQEDPIGCFPLGTYRMFGAIGCSLAEAIGCLAAAAAAAARIAHRVSSRLGRARPGAVIEEVGVHRKKRLSDKKKTRIVGPRARLCGANPHRVTL